MEVHEHRTNDPSVRIFLTVLLNGFITLIEILGGIFSNSLALISDAVHNLSDTLALALAWIAIRVGKRKPDERKTFGYKRFEILSAFINASVLTAISIYLIYIAVFRFFHPESVKSTLMLIIASVGMAANLVSVIFLHRDSHHSLNIKAAYLHLLGDTFSSLAVIGGSLAILITGKLWIDPALTIMISIVIIVQAYSVLKESIDILMQSTPGHIDLEAIKTVIEEHPMVNNVHHVHCWRLKDHDVHFEAHVEINEDITLSRSGLLMAEIESILKNDFNITHITFQVEYCYCDDKKMIRHSSTKHD